MSDYYVLGSGPVGSIVSTYLLERGFAVTVIDNSNNFVEQHDGQFIKKKVKDIFSKKFVTYSKEKKILPASSRAKGGFSEVWGGTLHLLDKEDFNNWYFKQDDLSSQYEYIIKKLDLPVKINNENNEHFASSLIKNYDDEINIIYSKLINNKDNIKKNHVSFSKASLFLKGEAIWSSSKLLEELSEKYGENFNYIQNYEVTDIKENKSQIILYSDKEKYIINNSKLIVATGGLSSSYLASKLLMKDNFKISNSTLKVFPLIWFGKKSKKNSINTFPQLYFDFKRKNEFTVRTQLYSLNKNFIETVNISAIPKTVLKGVSKIFRNRIFILFTYSHSTKSTYFDFKIKSEKIYLDNINKINSKDIWFVYFRLIKIFFKTLIFPLPITKKFNEYGSFHIGSSYIQKDKLNIKNNESNKFGQLIDNSNVHFVDSAVMPDIPSGPVTLTSMALALKVVDKIIE